MPVAAGKHKGNPGNPNGNGTWRYKTGICGASGKYARDLLRAFYMGAKHVVK
jgi:hypothetical protein